tara:strand:+ start:10 stop:993 length:984 start_codon:yes stop_codon:yes gene_type:complete
MIERFYQKKKNINLSDIIQLIKPNNILNNNNNVLINNISNLNDSKKNDITFFNNIKYKNDIKSTKALYCITKEKLSKYLPSNCTPLIVNNILLELSKITNLFYPNCIEDKFDRNLKNIEEIKIKKKIYFGKNVLIGNNVSFGENFSIGNNSIIESGVMIGDNVSIGSNVILRKCLVGNNVSILDGTVVGKKGFGFFPDRNKNHKYPHIGLVIIEDNVEIGCNNIIDRGSLSNTVIGKNTFIDNLVHIAHNVKLGKNCIIAGQVGFAGSTKIGDNVMIGGQAGISGHLKIGNNVKIGGGSGVIDDVPDNSNVMGYPSTNIRNFLKNNE